MKTTTAYEASDGSLWKTEEECILQENKIKADKSFEDLYDRWTCHGKIEPDDLEDIVHQYPDLFQYWIDTKEEK
tara:strand:- start:720 stop:941 length:222 start_codon:yes stop_codon:yes gene_type:complete